MKLEIGLEMPPWNAAPQTGSLLEDIAGEARLDFVVLPLVSGPASEFRLALDRDKPFFHTAGGWHFRPNAALYEPSGLRPHAADWLARHDVIADLRAQARQLGLLAFGQIDVGGVAAVLGEEGLATRTAWGAADPQSRACLSNPQFRELLRGLVQDAARYELDGFVLDAVAVDLPYYARFLPPESGAFARLLDFCFCAACREIADQAGVDPDQAARSVRAHAEALIGVRGTTGEPDDLESRLMRDDVLRSYCDARLRHAAAWIERLRQVQPQVRCYLRRSEADEARSLANPVARFEGSPQTWLSAEFPSSHEDAAAWAALRVEKPDMAGISLKLHDMNASHAPGLVKLVQDACDGGFGLFEFRDVHQAPPEAAHWVKQAVRFARRRVV